ncbi:hypothetical protein SPRG_13435 [Saprolegnia parasitica CBS 223.65]|uniref:Uncharacterized protein n=1 Tax=Saprolegnia parasitica (strain CBS 223.65) TaxID=695850 RepID=A0A067BR33_SAPPC|nr:hypothetical protein SPRG_13435 [Saprolegnia parasitica CBS 223.65]KDO20683.1 hypothetical protein SPRG_13435 [Saprolegnia parasitica CBS 223.65]|eukprot:XP_012208648.1 hypothetical protein SPRG_13435 [Saprolegnia parasitica CBS 223.65]
MQRRATAVKQSGSIWDKEATDYWKDIKVHDADASATTSQLGRVVLLAGAAMAALLLLMGGVYMTMPTDVSPEVHAGIVRANCTALAVQSRWHADMCKRICPENEFNDPCTNGCLYGTMTVTKAVCAERPLNATDRMTCVPRVDCAGACVEYASVRPIPAKRNACEGGCNSVVPSSCKRAMDLFDELAKAP